MSDWDIFGTDKPTFRPTSHLLHNLSSISYKSEIGGDGRGSCCIPTLLMRLLPLRARRLSPTPLSPRAPRARGIPSAPVRFAVVPDSPPSSLSPHRIARLPPHAGVPGGSSLAARPTFSHTHTIPPHRATSLHRPYLGLFFFSAQYLAPPARPRGNGAAQSA